MAAMGPALFLSVAFLAFLSPLGAGGASIFHPKIVGGVEAPVGRYTYIVSIKLPETKRHHCAGALVHPSWVVTAASCFLHYRQHIGQNFVFPVQIGGHDREDGTAEARQAALYIPARWNWSTFSIENGIDIAMLQLDRPSRKSPAKLAGSDTVLRISTPLTVMGWGRRQQRGQYANRLNHAQNLKFVAPNVCQYLHRRNVTRLICAGIGNVGPCAGDKGAPLVIHSESEPDTVVGIGTFFNGIYSSELCARTGRPAYFTDVRLTANREWIKDLIKVV